MAIFVNMIMVQEINLNAYSWKANYADRHILWALKEDYVVIECEELNYESFDCFKKSCNFETLNFSRSSWLNTLLASEEVQDRFAGRSNRILSPTPRHRCDVFLELCCPGAKLRNGPRHLLHTAA